MQVYRFPLPKMNASYWPLLVGKHPKLHPFFEDFWIFIKTSKNPLPPSHVKSADFSSAAFFQTRTFHLLRSRRSPGNFWTFQNHPDFAGTLGSWRRFMLVKLVSNQNPIDDHIFTTFSKVHISKTISTLAQIVAVHPEQVLAQQVTMKQVYHTIPSDMPWTVSSGTRDFRSCCEKNMLVKPLMLNLMMKRRCPRCTSW